MRSHLLEGTLRHRRTRPSVYRLEHGVFYLALDLDEIDEVARDLRLLGHNRRNIVEFRDTDHWLPAASDLRVAVRDHLRAEGHDPGRWRITLVTYPRVAGHVFNPASFYLCRDEADALRAVIVEVHNTFRERHLYTLSLTETREAHIATMAKDFYVSPFISRDARYTVRIQDRPEALRIVIDETERGVPLLQASLVLRRLPLTDRMLARALLRNPLVTLKTIAMIHVHAFRLWRRGIAFHRHGEVAT